MTSLELLQEIEAWLSFNTQPSKKELQKMRNDIKEHVSEQLNILRVSERYDLKVGYKNENGNMKEVIINAENCDEAYNKFKNQFGDIKVEYID